MLVTKKDKIGQKGPRFPIGSKQKSTIFVFIVFLSQLSLNGLEMKRGKLQSCPQVNVLKVQGPLSKVQWLRSIVAYPIVRDQGAKSGLWNCRTTEGANHVLNRHWGRGIFWEGPIRLKLQEHCSKRIMWQWLLNCRQTESDLVSPSSTLFINTGSGGS